jgi:hypothetical protein
MDSSGGFNPPPPPPPPGEGGGGGGMGGFAPKGLGDILSAAWDLYRQNAAQLIQIVAVVVVPLTLVQALLIRVALKQNCDDINTLSDLNRCTSTFGRSLLLTAISALIGVMIQQLLTGALTRGAAGSLIGRPVDVGGSYRYAFSRLGGLIGLALLIALVVGVGYVLLIIPGIIFSVFLAMAVPAFIVERRGVTDSMSRSWNLVSGSWWHVLGVVFVAGLLAGIVNGIITAIGGSTFIGYWIASAIAQIITAPFVALVAVVLYVDLRTRREGLDAGTLTRELDAAQA